MNDKERIDYLLKQIPIVDSFTSVKYTKELNDLIEKYIAVKKKAEKSRLDDLERRVKELEDEAAKNLPWPTKPWTEPDKWPRHPNDKSPLWPDIIWEDTIKCSKCGLNLESGTFGFVCGNSPCPIGAGSTMC